MSCPGKILPISFLFRMNLVVCMSSASLAQDCNQSICSIELVADTLSNLQTYSTPIAMYMEPPSAVMGKRTAPMPAQICTEGPAIDAVKEVAQASLSSQSTAVEWSRGLHDFVRCESVDTTEPHSPASSGKSEDSGIDHEPLEFGVLQFGAVLSKERALELQQALLQAFSSPGFQKKLHGVARRYRASHGNDPNCWSDFKELVRSYQADIIPSYGFEASGQGVRAMLQAFQPFENDPDIYVNATAINEALFSIMNRPDTSKDHVTSIGFGRKPVTNVAIMEMLQNLIIAFSCPSFQEDIRKLQRRADCNARRAEDPNGYYHLPGRADLALPLQQKTLKKYGFMANKQGVRDMIWFSLVFHTSRIRKWRRLLMPSTCTSAESDYIARVCKEISKPTRTTEASNSQNNEKEQSHRPSLVI